MLDGHKQKIIKEIVCEKIFPLKMEECQERHNWLVARYSDAAKCVDPRSCDRDDYRAFHLVEHIIAGVGCAGVNHRDGLDG